MSISTLRECPVQKKIHTKIATTSTEDRERVFRHIQEIVAGGGQVAVIYPRVSDEEKAKSSVEQAAACWEKILPNRIGVLHGRMSDEEKESVITRMKARKFDVLVASTVLEVGVSLPDLYAMLVVESGPIWGFPASSNAWPGSTKRRGRVFLYALPDGHQPRNTRAAGSSG